MDPQLYVQLNKDSKEFEISTKIPGLRFLSLTDTPVQTNYYQEYSGVDSSVFYYSTTSKNTVTAKFLLRYRNYYHYKALRQEIYQLFMQKHLYRLRTDAERMKVNYVIPTSFDIEPAEPLAKYAQITIAFENPSGYKFSRYRSDEQKDIWDDYPLGWHLPVLTGDAFIFRDNTFNVYNPSDIAIDPYMQKNDLKLKMKFQGSDINVQNETNGSNWTFNDQVTMQDTIVLDGINTYLNGSPASGKTNFGNLVLDTGWNKISVGGAAEMEMIFSFPFVYID